MKLLFAIIQTEDEKPLTRALVEQDISVTRISSSGGFLHSGNATLMIGVEADRLQDALDIIKAKSHRRKTLTVTPSFSVRTGDQSPMTIPVNIGGATVFIVDVEQFHKF